jgi:hypothetical protein
MKMISRLIKRIFTKRTMETKERTEFEIINARLEKLEADLGKALCGYRTVLIKENPDILPDLIEGESIEALDLSLTAAREITEKIKTRLEAQQAAERIPGGAPVRTPLDMETLSSHEKIIQGLERH